MRQKISIDDILSAVATREHVLHCELVFRMN
jgi:hypothetical protein